MKRLKELIQLLILIFIFSIINFLIFCFITLDYNVLNWHFVARIIFIIIEIIIIFNALMVSNLDNIVNKDEF
jgi:hypothetical protein